ncbi:hypothetical protein Dsin_011502 [Dipteronia sinensis]|uniref:Uncharacterized protein n=1 Tax=Dipteronia sinensis TaxID=43782 RepID=A0AAE0AUR2_9ROSI|nr:hypothetical protein Dsin_011502 [Dipteronia sinensis]
MRFTPIFSNASVADLPIPNTHLMISWETKVSSTVQYSSANKVFSSSNHESAKQNFPKFDGSDPKLWIRKWDRAFLLHPVPEDQKVLVASSQFEKKAKIWYQLVYARRVGVTWREFVEAVLDRFLNEKQEVVVMGLMRNSSFQPLLSSLNQPHYMRHQLWFQLIPKYTDN